MSIIGRSLGRRSIGAWTAAAAVLIAAGLAGSGPASTASGISGTWELSNAARDRRCTVSLLADQAGPGLAVQAEEGCAKAFPFVRDIVAWKALPPVGLLFLNASGATLVEFTSVEDGLYEGERRGNGLLFLQNLASRSAEERSPGEIAGNWTLMAPRGRQGCRIVLSDKAAANDTFALVVRPGCDASVGRFEPAAWRFDRGQLVILSKGGEAWRFEEADPNTWHRVPAGRQPLHLVRD